jgi:polar amino acid transport system substrate-binding protein
MVITLALALVGAAAGCKKEPEQPTLEPAVEPPAIATAGILRAGVDLSYPPFAGSDRDVNAGIDVDVAAAIAERLGLKLELVDVKPAGIAEALNTGKVDIMLGATPVTEVVLANVANAGSYLIDGPAIFSVVATDSVPTTLTADDLPGMRVAAQSESPAFWTLESEFGEGFALPHASLVEAFEALVAGEADALVGDAAVAAYIARDYPGVAFVGQLGPAQPLAVAVRKDALELETAVRSALDALAADGTLDTIRSKWLGELPGLEVPTEVPVG